MQWHRNDRLVVFVKEWDKDAFENEDGVFVTVDACMPVGFHNYAKKREELGINYYSIFYSA